jgi:hypothetical protein
MTTRTGTSSRLNPLRCHPAIPLGTTNLSCGKYAEDLTCRRYAADEITTHEAIAGVPNVELYYPI